MICRSCKALIEDVNQKKDQHATKNKYWSDRGVLVIRNKLPYGDYILAPETVVDTKRDIMELAQNIKSDHRRFRDAAIKAFEAGSHLVILTENDEDIKSLDDLKKWAEPMRIYETRKRKNPRARRFYGSEIAKSCTTMTERYGVEFDFCEPNEAGRRVLEILGVVEIDT